MQLMTTIQEHAPAVCPELWECQAIVFETLGRWTEALRNRERQLRDLQARTSHNVRPNAVAQPRRRTKQTSANAKESDSEQADNLEEEDEANDSHKLARSHRGAQNPDAAIIYDDDEVDEGSSPNLRRHDDEGQEDALAVADGAVFWSSRPSQFRQVWETTRRIVELQERATAEGEGPTMRLTYRAESRLMLRNILTQAKVSPFFALVA